MELDLNEQKYTFLVGYQKEQKYRNAFNVLAEKTFPISFEVWYESGYWKEKYIPYTIFVEDKAIANVSVNIMDFNTFGERKRYIQLGTVMTDENYRNKGLSRFLMEKVFNDWSDNCEFIYLYANSTVLNFYPKFGFSPVKEYEYFKKIKSSSSTRFVKLSMDNQANKDKLYDYIKNTKIFAKLAMEENADLVMFYCITHLKDCVYFSRSLDVFAIAKFNDSQIHLLDVFSKAEVNLDIIIDSLNNNAKVDSVLLGFTPKNYSTYDVRQVVEVPKDVLFIQNGKTKLFDENRLMFPLLSHA